MLILSRVCAEFHDRTGAVIHRITPETRLTFREAPDAIRQDPLFQMLLSEGSLEAAVSPVQQRAMEADPLADTTPTGAKIPAPSTSPDQSLSTDPSPASLSASQPSSSRKKPSPTAPQKT